MVIRHGKLVYERYLEGSGRNQANNIHSASKSMLQALVGIAVREGLIGSIDDKVSEYLPEYFTNAPASEKTLTIRDLMSMASGLYWIEDNTEYKLQSSSDWVGGVLGQRMKWDPGTAFNYSTGNTHVLSAVLQAATGTALLTHVRPPFREAGPTQNVVEATVSLVLREVTPVPRQDS